MIQYTKQIILGNSAAITYELCYQQPS